MSVQVARSPCSPSDRRAVVRWAHRTRGAMFESGDEIRELQAPMDRTFARANPHLLAIVKPERRLNARQVVRYLQGTKHVAFATVNARGEPRCRSARRRLHPRAVHRLHRRPCRTLHHLRANAACSAPRTWTATRSASSSTVGRRSSAAATRASGGDRACLAGNLRVEPIRMGRGRQSSCASSQARCGPTPSTPRTSRVGDYQPPRPVSAVDGDRVVVRAATAGTTPRCSFGVHLDPDVMRFWDGRTFTDDEMAARITRPHVDPYIVEADGETVGYLQAWFGDTVDVAGLDMFLIPTARGRSLDSDAARTLAKYSITHAGRKRITVDPYLWNERAVRAGQQASVPLRGTRARPRAS